jgi:hypothetical protein
VGIIGYFYHGPILDIMGLISDKPLKYYPIKNQIGPAYLIPPEAISAFKPKYLIAPSNHCQGMLLDDADFKRNYTELKRWPDATMTDGFVGVWGRKDEPEKQSQK